jgi:hypothetical protein
MLVVTNKLSSKWSLELDYCHHYSTIVTFHLNCCFGGLMDDLTGEDERMITDSSEPKGSATDLQRMIVELDRQIAQDPTSALAHEQRGNAYFQLKEYQRAVSDYTRALELDPQYTPAYVHRGQAYAALGYHQWAAADFSRAEELDWQKQQLVLPPQPVASGPPKTPASTRAAILSWRHACHRWLGPLILRLGLLGPVVRRRRSKASKNGLAIAGFVFGIIGLLTSWLLFGALFCIPGIILSAVGMRRSGARGGKGLAIAGLVLSNIGFMVAVTILLGIPNTSSLISGILGILSAIGFSARQGSKKRQQ